MNKMRRKELSDLIKVLRMAETTDDVCCVVNTLENIRDDEESYYDNIPENLQCSQRAYDSENAIDNMNDALNVLEEICNSKDNTNEQFKSAIVKAVDKINSARY